MVLETDLRHGQKTGEFLDQRENRKRVARESVGRAVLDLYCYTGLFSLHCGMAGAASVLGIDSSAPAIERARLNAARNAPGRETVFEVEGVERALERLAREEARFDMIVLDPPALVRSRKMLAEGARKYVALNSSALQLLKPGGTLATATCSHHVDAGLFQDTVLSAAFDAHRILRRVATYSQSPDHPIIPMIPETEYLKGFAFEIVR